MKPFQAEVKGKILEYAWWLKKNGRSEQTIKGRIKLLNSLAKVCNIMDPEHVKLVIAEAKWNINSKRLTVTVYDDFAKFAGLSWEKPKYRKVETLPFIPLEKEIDQLIASCSKRISALLQLLKETGVRIGEAVRLRWIDLDVQRKTVTVQPEKGSNPRIFNISENLCRMLNGLRKKNDFIFGNPNPDEIRKQFIIQRKRAAQKLNNPRIRKISFHSIRHWKGTMEYHRTKDPWYVKKLLGHKSLKTTEVYINIEQALFQEQNDEFHVKTAQTPEEIKALLEVGFEYVCQKDGIMFFRKRK